MSSVSTSIYGYVHVYTVTKYLSKISEAAFLDMERGALKHMNDDHQDNMKEICKGLYSIEASSVEMVELNIGGCMLKT